MTSIAVGELAPTFSLPSTSGQRVSLAEALTRGPVVIAFYKVTCPVCQFTFPFLERIHAAYGESAAVFGISQDDLADSREFMQECGITFPNLLDEKGYPVSNAYGLTMVPTVFLVAPDGKVKVSSMGFSKPDLEKISALLAAAIKIPTASVFLPKEVVPEYKPG
jgi:peroxiredoxin